MSYIKQTEKEIREAYIFLRENNTSIPSETLQFMLDASLEKLKKSEYNQGNWIKFEETKFVKDGIYPIKTSEGRIILAERFKGSWIEYDTPIKENESVVNYYD